MKHKIEMLKKAYKKYCESYEFEPGDIIQWKPLVRPAGYNRIGPYLVMKVEDPEEDPSCHFKEKHLVVAIIDDKGRFDTFCLQACYFEPVDEEDRAAL